MSFVNFFISKLCLPRGACAHINSNKWHAFALYKDSDKILADLTKYLKYAMPFTFENELCTRGRHSSVLVNFAFQKLINNMTIATIKSLTYQLDYNFDQDTMSNVLLTSLMITIELHCDIAVGIREINHETHGNAEKSIVARGRYTLK